MVGNLDKEYTSVNTIYEQQKEYRKTPEGKLALKRANERQLLKKMTAHNCGECGENEFEVLNIYDGITLCYNCRYRREKVLELNEFCQ
jgi:uncharacterized Zn finger protein (UPF0148 family)|tara:strand:- start:3123 stop:3386 length:264 start_codon:yes stop_codon:yes gene_type:complete